MASLDATIASNFIGVGIVEAVFDEEIFTRMKIYAMNVIKNQNRKMMKNLERSNATGSIEMRASVHGQ